MPTTFALTNGTATNSTSMPNIPSAAPKTASSPTYGMGAASPTTSTGSNTSNSSQLCSGQNQGTVTNAYTCLNAAITSGCGKSCPVNITAPPGIILNGASDCTFLTTVLCSMDVGLVGVAAAAGGNNCKCYIDCFTPLCGSSGTGGVSGGTGGGSMQKSVAATASYYVGASASALLITALLL
jgi:hypothetical protein